jgi:hypothetical protein
MRPDCIQLDADVIRYSSREGGWELRIADVGVIGEATNGSGPWGIDYFLCFATGPDLWFEASFYADGRDEFLRALGHALGNPVELGLCSSVDLASRILWPPSLAGEPMFQFTDVPPKTWLGKLVGPLYNCLSISDPVAKALAAR